MLENSVAKVRLTAKIRGRTLLMTKRWQSNREKQRKLKGRKRLRMPAMNVNLRKSRVNFYLLSKNMLETKRSVSGNLTGVNESLAKLTKLLESFEKRISELEKKIDQLNDLL
eukprot:Lithocolla_globosa_v1_NODE_2471_length_1988_cov_487.873771.p3 type:complete len:112 gc:universal NODE_2471_length_1988_cov_487.873771:564-229(-)